MTKRNAILVGDIPDNVFKKITQSAKQNHRTKGKEILNIVEASVGKDKDIFIILNHKNELGGIYLSLAEAKAKELPFDTIYKLIKQ